MKRIIRKKQQATSLKRAPTLSQNFPIRFLYFWYPSTKVTLILTPNHALVCRPASILVFSHSTFVTESRDYRANGDRGLQVFLWAYSLLTLWLGACPLYKI